jgi:hypothetical protein
MSKGKHREDKRARIIAAGKRFEIHREKGTFQSSLNATSHLKHSSETRASKQYNTQTAVAADNRKR